MVFGKQKEIIGIDIGSSSVKLVQLREAKGKYHLVNMGIRPLPQEAIVDNAIMDSNSIIGEVRALLDGLKIKVKNVATSISGHSVIIRKISLPIMTEDEMESSIQWEAEQYIPFDISEVNLDFQILGTDSRDSTQMNVLLVAAKKEFVNDYVALFKECGLNPAIMDIDCFAIENAFEASYGSEMSEIVGLLNMGASAMNINILKEGMSVFTRDIQVGGSMFNEEIQKRLGLSSEEAEKAKLGVSLPNIDHETVLEVIQDAVENLSQEVQRSLDFFSATSADEKVNKLYITGGVSRTAQVKIVLEERLGIPVEVFNPFDSIIIPPHFDSEYLQNIGPLLSVAAGLAMRRMGDK